MAVGLKTAGAEWADALPREAGAFTPKQGQYYIDEDTGDLPEVIPERVLSLAIFFGAIVAWVTDHLPDRDEHTNVPCRRSPERRRCRGDIIAQLEGLAMTPL